MTLNLNDGSFRPYHKPDEIFQYINKKSKHQPNLIEHLPSSIEKWLSNNSSDENKFKETAISYEDTLNKAGYTSKLFYHAPNVSNQKKQNHKLPTIHYMV